MRDCIYKLQDSSSGGLDPCFSLMLDQLYVTVVTPFSMFEIYVRALMCLVLKLLRDGGQTEVRQLNKCGLRRRRNQTAQEAQVCSLPERRHSWAEPQAWTEVSFRGSVVTLRPKCCFLCHPKKEAMPRPQRHRGADPILISAAWSALLGGASDSSLQPSICLLPDVFSPLSVTLERKAVRTCE
ncbi:hypothetical protein CRENBAI_014951 [Crenichthys baileyi]|uniref:Uncharacterized protein n=1 Tax=Crenichthys baileyi TaxID=28760 RepID=A0AAV9RJK3_9TELE